MIRRRSVHISVSCTFIQHCTIFLLINIYVMWILCYTTKITNFTYPSPAATNSAIWEMCLVLCMPNFFCKYNLYFVIFFLDNFFHELNFFFILSSVCTFIVYGVIHITAVLLYEEFHSVYGVCFLSHYTHADWALLTLNGSILFHCALYYFFLLYNERRATTCFIIYF